MFNRISFMLDDKNRYTKGEPFREIVAGEHCAALGFRLSDGDACAMPGKSLIVSRVPCASGPSDPWVEDGKPPTTLLIVHAATVRFLGTVVEVVGFEQSVLLAGGYMVDPVKHAVAKKVKGPFVPVTARRIIAADAPLVPIHLLLK